MRQAYYHLTRIQVKCGVELLCLWCSMLMGVCRIICVIVLITALDNSGTHSKLYLRGKFKLQGQLLYIKSVCVFFAIHFKL